MDISEAKALLDTEIQRVKDIASGGDPFAAMAANMRLRLLDLISHLFDANSPVEIDPDKLVALEARVAKLEEAFAALTKV